MSNKTIREALENAFELFEDSTAGIQEAVEYTADRLGISVAKVEKAYGWR